MVATISPSMLADLRRRGETLTLIDVRTPAEFGEVHVDFARNIPLDRLDSKAISAIAGPDPVYVKNTTHAREAFRKAKSPAKWLTHTRAHQRSQGSSRPDGAIAEGLDTHEIRDWRKRDASRHRRPRGRTGPRKRRL
jgi:rhodanese-related sulfurtransferase